MGQPLIMLIFICVHGMRDGWHTAGFTSGTRRAVPAATAASRAAAEEGASPPSSTSTAAPAPASSMRTNWPLRRGRAWASCLRFSYRIFFVKHRFCTETRQMKAMPEKAQSWIR